MPNGACEVARCATKQRDKSQKKARPEEMEKADVGRDPNDNADAGLNAVVAFDCRALQVTESALVGRAFAAAEAGCISHASAQTHAGKHTHSCQMHRTNVCEKEVFGLGS